MALAADPGIDVLVEVIGGAGDPAKRAVETALAAGKPVVTANKALLASHGPKLAALAERHRVALNFEASIAGGIPIVKTLREGLNGNAFSRIYGILNGTCNYILSRMEEDRISFDECLREAQRLGYAEADPSFDVEGHDTAQKLSILASLAFGTKVDPAAIYVEGISSITLADLDAAAELGYRVKLLGVAVRTEAGIEQRVHPTMVPREFGDRAGHGCDQRRDGGRGGAYADHAGRARRRRPGDRLVRRVRSRRHRPRRLHAAVRTAGGANDGNPQGADAAPRRRLLYPAVGADRPGSAATIARRLAQRQISLESIVQRHETRAQGAGQPGRSNDPVPVILITYATSEDAVHKALAAVRRDRVISGRPQVIRIEKN